jgi:acyl-ACP thioesterase
MLNFIQDVGWLHANHLEVKLPKNRGWVFTRQKLKMQKWPGWNETVEIKTWLRQPNSEFFLLRDYEIFLQGEKIGECTSTFTVIDLEKRKLAVQDWSEFSSTWRTDHQLSEEPEKIIIGSQMKNLAEFQVRNSDIDLNHHVNNTKYAQWILDALPIEILKAGVDLKEYQVNFLAEAKSGDVIVLQQTVEDIPDGQGAMTQFQGERKSDKKIVFTSQMRIKNS